MKQNEQIKQPFFVKFLESQRRATQDQNGVTKPIWDWYETHKYPSDSDEGGEPAYR